jgi:signal transduction histidine kinase
MIIQKIIITFFRDMYKIFITLIIINILIVLPLYFYLKNIENDSINSKMNDIGEQILSVTTENAENVNHELLRSVSAFSENGIYISNKSFINYLQYDNFVYKKNVQTFFWIARVFYNDTTVFEKFCSENVYPNFTIKELNATTNTMIPVKKRIQYWPIVYFDPYIPAYEFLIGYDASQTPWTLYLIYLAQLNVSASFRIDLAKGIYENPYSYGAIIATGAYINKSFIGGMYAIINANSLFQQSFRAKNLDEKDINLFVFDVTNDGLANNTKLNISLLYKNNVPENQNIWFETNVQQNFNTKRHVFKFLQRTWIVYFSFTNSYIEKVKSNTYIIITVSIVAILILLDIICMTYVYFIGLYKKQIRYEIENKNIERQKKDKARQTINYVNHEVRNPLNVIKSLLELNLDQLKKFIGLVNDADLIKIANDISTNEKIVNIPLSEIITLISDYYTALGSCNLVEHIVNDVQDLQKLEENKLVLREKNINISDFVMQFNKSIRQKLNEKQDIKYVVNVDKSVQSVRTDPMRLTQILLNYFSNAIKFTDVGKIELNIYHFDDDIRFEITDTGCGIKDVDKPKIFTQFAQFDDNNSTSNSTRHQGFGLGLYLCNSLAKGMNGSVGYESAYNIGSKFWLQLKRNDKVHVVKIHQLISH